MIYLFDKDEKLFKIINKPALKTVLQKYALTTEQYVSDRLTVEMKSLDADELEKVEYMAIQTIEDAHTFHYFYVAQKYTEQLTTLIGVQSGIEELRKTPVWDKRPKNAFAKNVINDLLKGTNWQARFVGETTQRSTSFYYISVFEALKKVCKVWDLEMQFFVEMNGNKIGARYIDFKRKIGSAVGKRVVYGHNALQILQEVERTNLFTALIGRGKGEQVSSAEESDKKTDGYGRKITFENVVWDVAKGNPVNKPKGQRFVELPEMTKIYGIKNTDGSIRPKIGFVDFQEEEDPGFLLERTYKALVDAARPQLTLKTTSAYLRGVKVGDTIRVVRHDKKLDYDTRIFEITFNRLNNESSDIKLGDRIGESNEAKAQTIAEKVVDDFVSNEFSDFVQKLPDFLPSPDGFNNNWYGAEDPTVKYPGKVLINDIWFKPDPEHEGHKIMLRWTGEVWDEIVRSYDKELLTKRISEEIANFDKTFQSVNEQNKKKIDEILQSSGASSSLAQEAKRIGLDSIAKLEEFKTQATSAQTALSGDLDALKRTIANDIRPKQAQAEAEISKQVEALVQTKKELAGVKSAQSMFEQSTTRRLAELTNLANGKASKSELTQTAEELASKIASVRVGGRNYYRDSERVQTKTRFFSFPLHPYLTQENIGETWTLSFDLKINESGEIRPLHFYHYQTNRFGIKASGDITPSKEWQRFTFTGPVIFPNDDPRYSRGDMALYDKAGDNNYSVRRIKFERGSVATDWTPALEDTDGRILTIESSFRQRADALDAGVSRLTEGLRTKADISTLNVTAENIRQSVKSLETSTQNKLDQKLSQAEFEVQAGSIRQEILNATKDKADKTLVVAEAGKLREEFSNLRFGGRNYYRDSEKVQTKTRFFSFPLHPYLTQENIGETWTLSFDLKINESGEIRPLHFYHYQTNRFGIKASGDITPSKEWQRFTFTGPVIFPNDDPRYSRGDMALYDKAGDNNYSVRRIKFERGSVATDWTPALEDTEGLVTEAKATFERTAQGLRTDLSAIQTYVNKDGQRQEALQRYSREESAKQATAVRELVARDYVGKSTYQEDVRGLERRFEAITNPKNGSIATQIANYKTAVDGRFADITSLISGKANQTDFQRVRETSQLYERILGNTENGIADKVARMAMTNQLFQVEVSKNENLKTVQRQLAGSWGVHNKNSVNEIIAGFNLAGRNAGIKAETIRLEGKTLLDELTAIQGYFKRLFVGEGTFATLNADVIRTNSITADKLVFNEALANRLVLNEIITSKLVASRAFVNALNAVTIDASQIVTGTLKGDRIYGGTIRGTNIYGGTLTGHTKIQLGSYGSFDTVNGGLQINVPRDYNSKDGLGVQFIGSYGRGENVPYGLFLYRDSDFTVGGTVETSNEFLLTVEGYINANGIGWMKTGKGSVNGQTTATIGLWNSENVSLDFGGSGNDIYYSYNGTAYSLWSVVKQHFSDRRLKENIVDCNHKALDYIQQLQFKEYDWKKQEDRPQQAHTKIGLIAQEVQAVDPTLVYENGDTLNLDNLRLTTIALKAIQELSQRIETLERKLA